MDLNDDELEQLYTGRFKSDFLENEYLIVVAGDNVFDYFQWRGGKFERVGFPVISNEMTGDIKPRNPEQYCAMDLLLRKEIPVKLITGKFGSGKSLLCITAALQAVWRGEFEKIIFVRNNVQVKDTDQLGALPGSDLEKTLPYVMPVADHCGGIEGLRYLLENKKLEVIPLGFLRGRSIKNSILYSMESENLTKEHIQLILGRVDEGSQLWMDGDLKQRDRQVFEKSAGLERMVETLKGNELFGYVHLIKSERSKVAQLCDLMD